MNEGNISKRIADGNEYRSEGEVRNMNMKDTQTSLSVQRLKKTTTWPKFSRLDTSECSCVAYTSSLTSPPGCIRWHPSSKNKSSTTNQNTHDYRKNGKKKNMNNVLFLLLQQLLPIQVVLRNKYCNVAIATTAVTAEPTARPPREHTGDELWTTCGVISSRHPSTRTATTRSLQLLPTCGFRCAW